MSLSRARLFGWAIVALSAVAWSTAGLFTRAVHVNDVWTILFWRGVFSGFAIMALTVVQYRGQTASAYRRLGWAGILLAACSAAGMVTYLGGLMNTTVANVCAIYATVPFVTAACAFLLLKERSSRSTLIASAFALVGVLLTINFADLRIGDIFGQFLAFLMTISMGLVTVIVRWKRELPMVPALGLSAWMATAVSALFCHSLSVDLHDLVLLALFGMTQSALGLTLFGIGSRMIPPAEVALIGLIDVPLGPFWVWLLFDETPNTQTLLGGAIVLAAVIGHILAEMWTVAARPVQAE